MKNMIIALFLNLAFAIFEFIGGTYTNSIAITSNAIHDIGDAFSIGIACFLEKKSKRPPDDNFTFGYSRYSVISAMKSSSVLFTSSIAIIVNMLNNIKNPQQVNYNGMLIIAVIGLSLNIVAAFLSKREDSLNAKAVSLHILKDVLSWAIIFIGAIIMKFTDFALLDILLSIGTSIFILVSAFRNIKSATNILTDKVPKNINAQKTKAKIMLLDGIKDIPDFKIWSLDEHNIYATVHIVSDKNIDKEKVKAILSEAGVTNSTIEIE